MSASILKAHDSADSGIQFSDRMSTKSTPSASFGQPLNVDFNYKKFKAIISARDDPQAASVYDVKIHAFSPHYTFHSPARNNTSIGTGTLHAVQTKATCTVHSNEITLQPLKRLATKYNYLSLAFKHPDGSRAVMVWDGTLKLKTWDFIMLDEHQLPIARFKANVWGVRDLGSIEFMDPDKVTEAMRDEIIVTGTMVYQQMMLRSTNIFNLIGAGFSKTGPVRAEKAE
ncbi:Hypothetical protein R9X50_00416700 [Acrodontium crateriforme]|uniref:Uncharacterized protein n=1 Tax=Acrodontium crateriforme TaxID=150365 RepID=A0AAQ3M724_9PEZI|nr:Hypothetical protein R9X50_00416700 [Acrodontium crateriforme]